MYCITNLILSIISMTCVNIWGEYLYILYIYTTHQQQELYNKISHFLCEAGVILVDHLPANQGQFGLISNLDIQLNVVKYSSVVIGMKGALLDSIIKYANFIFLFINTVPNYKLIYGLFFFVCF